MRRAVMVICDGLRSDMVSPQLTPNLCRLRSQATVFKAHRGVFPSTTRTTSASIATGCHPARHGLEGNCVALDEGEGLVAMSVGPPSFRDRMQAATGQTLRVPTIAERVSGLGGAIVFSNVSPGAAVFQDPDGHGHVFHRDISYGTGRTPVAESKALDVTHDTDGDTAMTERFITEVLAPRQVSWSVLWQCEPDHSQHDHALGSPEHLQAVRCADANVGRVLDHVDSQPESSDLLLIAASDHGHETITEIFDLESLLIDAGLKRSLASNDVVVASNGFSAAIYLSDAAVERCEAIVQLCMTESRIGEVFSGDSLNALGHRTDSALRVVVTGAFTEAANEYGVPGGSVAFLDRLAPESRPGCGQHGGLGRHEQHPFLMIKGAGFAPGTVRDEKTSAIDIAPTVLDFLGLEATGMDGRVLV